jgi:hypothetical protein
MMRGRSTRLTQDRIQRLEKAKFVWEAQRGGPRRQRRAIVCVPTQANPKIRKDPPLSQGGLNATLVLPRGPPQQVGQASIAESATATASVFLHPGAMLPAMGATVTTCSTAAGPGAAESNGAGVAAGSEQPVTADGIKLNLGMADAVQGAVQPPWQVLPCGAFQQQPGALGIFPLATPLPIAAAGYQLGMIPASLVPDVGIQMADPNLEFSKMKKRKRRESKQKSRRLGKRHTSKEEEEEEDQSESEEESDEEKPDE